MADNSTKTNLVAKILFIAGGIILFIVLVLFIFKIVPLAVSGLSNIFSKVDLKPTEEKITLITESDTAEVKIPFVLSFEYEPQEDKVGQYFVSYSCIEGLFFDIQSKNGPKRIICDTPLKLGSNIDSISLSPLFTKELGFVDSTLTISYRDGQGNIIDSGSKTITVTEQEDSSKAEGENPYTINGSLSGSTVTTAELKPEAKTPTTTTQPVTTTYTKPTKDLVVTHIAPGQYNSSFVIHIYNYGNTSVGPWEFTYTDAENPSRVISSPMQASLKAGQGLAVTVRFDGQKNSKQTVQVVVDPYNKIQETNELNNSSSVVVTGNSSGSNSNDSYNRNDDADLTITSIEVGKISGNRFVEDQEIDTDNTAAIRFVVKNIGGESTGSWRFEIDNLPYDQDDTYRSKSYSSLQPGESVEVVLEFEGINDGRYSIKVDVDSDDDVDEEDERNNDESETLDVRN